MRYLSPEWFAAAQSAIENDDQLRKLSSELDLTIEQTVTEGPEDLGAEQMHGTGPSGSFARPQHDPPPIQWHVVLDHGSARLGLGPATEADLRFRAPYPVASAIAQGKLAAPLAFVRGDLTVGGNLQLLTAHQQTLAALDDVMREVREATTFV